MRYDPERGKTEMIDTFVTVAVTGLQGIASMAVAVAAFGAVGIGGVWLIERRTPCNPYAVFPCPCPPEGRIDG